MKNVSHFIICIAFLFLASCHGNSDQQKNKTSPIPIDRFDLVNRHNVILNEADPLAPMTVGNGDFAYTADITGMQSLENYYYKNGIPLETLSNWAWHSFPNTQNYRLQDAMKGIEFHGRKVLYASEETSPAGQYFRVNPHPVPLGQISLVWEDGKPLDLSMITRINQKLDIWKGVIYSQYEIDGQPVKVETVCHPELSLVAFKIKSPLLKSGKLRPAFRFPYSYDLSIKNKPPFDWSKPDRHTSTIITQDDYNIVLKRTIDTSLYYVGIHWNGKGVWEKKGPHDFSLNASGSDSLMLVCEFSPDMKRGSSPDFPETLLASERSWKDYWTKGGAVDLSGSTDPRAPELERRIVLSQYLVKVNYSGSFPPQESGLAHISWFGKHNSEVYWIHAAQFYQWNHTDLLENGLKWYRKILPSAQADAKSKGFEGACWPKMSGYDGRQSPGSINPFIIWNQPNPIYLSELVYRAHPDIATLNKYRDIVFESAKFLASYAFYDEKTGRYILGPPIKSVNESTEENKTMNPSFELAQWYYGLKVAQDWRDRLGMKREAHWDDIMNKLAPLTIQDGKYVEIESDPYMYSREGGFSSAMIMALGYLPKTPMVDYKTMQNTFKAIVERNSISSFVSWSMGKGALTAARLGDQQIAVDIICNDSPAARFNKSGYVMRPKDGLICPAYLPVNSSFLAAVALMAGGWDDAPDINAPGFPQDGKWNVRAENILKLP
jgi:Trehalose and maltose hydrolases (possible phosphorylases)